MTYQDETELAALVQHFKALSPRTHVLEIGSLLGETLSFWMENMSPGGGVISIDLMVPPSDGRYEKQKLGHELTWHLWAKRRGLNFFCLDRDSKDQLCLDTVRFIMPDIDFLFIDGGHDYDTCRSDWMTFGPLVRPGGMVAFHDLGKEWPDVRRVWQLARRDCRSEEIVQTPDRFGIGVLWKPGVP